LLTLVGVAPIFVSHTPDGAFELASGAQVRCPYPVP
jgi:hypothetical protein